MDGNHKNQKLLSMRSATPVEGKGNRAASVERKGNLPLLPQLKSHSTPLILWLSYYRAHTLQYKSDTSWREMSCARWQRTRRGAWAELDTAWSSLPVPFLCNNGVHGPARLRQNSKNTRSWWKGHFLGGATMGVGREDDSKCDRTSALLQTQLLFFEWWFHEGS